METKNLATTHPDKVQHLIKMLDAWWNGKPENYIKEMQIDRMCIGQYKNRWLDIYGR